MQFSRLDKIYLVGAGGHAKVLIDTVEALGGQVAALYEEDGKRVGRLVLGVAVEGGPDDVPTRASVIVAVGDNSARERLVLQLAAKDAVFPTIVHPGAIVSRHASLGPGSVVLAQAVVQAGAVVGAHCIINTAATVDHDCTLGDFSQICPGVHLAGSVRVGRSVFVATGASVAPGILLGDRSVVGAGAAVLRDIPNDAKAFGVPATVR